MYLIGVDEVGRGALAGPVVVGAVAVVTGKRFSDLRDSKKLTPGARKGWLAYIKNRPEIIYAVGRVYPKKIDKVNISKAANLAATHACLRLFTRLGRGEEFKVYLDGGLYLNEALITGRGFICKTKTIIKGDEKVNAIKLASIVAKVTRDRYMVKLSNTYPKYGFALHKGYGTSHHLKAIKKHGSSVVHRRSFKIK